jgi:uncharacterized repeat protein (TIGR01451 family)
MLGDPKHRSANPLSPRGWAASIAAAALMVVGAPIVDTGPLTILSAPPASADAAPTTTPFLCDNTFYAMQQDPAGNILGRISFPPPGQPTGAQFTPISQAPDYSWNAMGFNHVDGFVYAVAGPGALGPDNDRPVLFRTDAAGHYELLGVPVNGAGEPWGTEGFPAGAILAGGRFVAIPGSSDVIYTIAATQKPPRIVSQPAVHFAEGNAGDKPQFSDLAVNPLDDQIYAFDEANQRIARIDRSDGSVTFVSPVLALSPAGNKLAPNGSTWIEGNGRITLLGKRDTDKSQDTFFTADFNPVNGMYSALRQIGIEPGLSAGSDGSHCAYRMTMDKTVSPTTVRAGEDVTYTYTITNGTANTATFNFRDALSNGRTFVGNPVITGSGGTPSFNGARTELTITGMQLGEDAVATVIARVHVPTETAPGQIFNQAELSSIVSGNIVYNGIVKSNFPETPDPADPTPLTVTAALADLTISKAGQATVQPGGVITYTLTVHNNGPSTSTSSVVTDTLPAGFQPQQALGGGGSVNGQTATWNIDDDIPAGGEVQRTLTVRAPNEGHVDNTAHVDPGPGSPGDPTPGNNNSNTVPTDVIASADLSITKEGPATVQPGAEFDYVLHVRNAGPSTSGPSTVTDTVTTGFQVLSANNGGQVNGQTVTWSLGAIPPNNGPDLSIHVRAPLDAAVAKNTAHVEPTAGGPGDPTPGNNTSNEITTNVQGVADLSVAKEGPATAEPGETFTYTIRVHNAGPSTSGEARISDDIPVGFTPVSASDGGQINGQTVGWTINAVPSGGDVVRTVQVKAPLDGGVAHNTATLTPNANGPTDPNGENNRSNQVDTTATAKTDLSVTKSGPETAQPGQPFNYTITVTNAGPSTATAAVVEDDVPIGFTPTAASNGGQISGQHVVWTVGPIAAGASVPLTLTVTAPVEGGVADNRASVHPGPNSPQDPNHDNDISTITHTTVTPQADLVLTKEVPADAVADQEITFTIRVTNKGPSTSTGADISDPIPAGFTPVRASDGGQINGQTVTWHLGSMAPGANVAVTVTVRTPVEGGRSDNVATVTPGPNSPQDPDLSNNKNPPATTIARAQSDISLTKAGAAPFIEANEPFEWRITAHNAGPSTAKNATITDTLPPGFTILEVSDNATIQNGNTVIWSFASFPKGDKVLRVKVVTPTVTVVTNRASATAETEDPNPQNNTAESTVPVRGFTLAKTYTGPASVRAGDKVTYTITATNPSTVGYNQQNGLASFVDDMKDLTDDATIESVTPSAGQIGNATNQGFTWTGPIAANGGTATVTVVAVVNGPDDEGDNLLTNRVTGGTNCRADAPAGQCSVNLLPVRELKLTKTVDKTVVSPGDTLTYTVTVQNTGRYAFTLLDPAVVTDEMKDVLDDATFGNASAGSGLIVPPVPPATTTLTWTSPLDVGATVTITYTVTVNNPQTGDGKINNAVSTPEDPRCLPDKPCGPPENTLVKAFLLDKSADRSAETGVAPTEEVTYTVTVTNSGQVDYTAEQPATFNDDLSDIVDDATLVEIGADVGEVDVADDTLTWSGPLPVADPPGTVGATITVTVRVKNPDLDGNHFLVNVVSGSSNCPPPENSPTHGTECTAGDPLPIKGLTVDKVSDVDFVRAGGVVKYRLTVRNTGQVDYTEGDPAVVVDDLSGVLDDADYNNDAAATNGEPVAFDAAGKTLTWAGPLPKVPAGDQAPAITTITITYSVTVHRPGDGDHSLHNALIADDSNCPASPDEGAEPDPACTGGTEDNGGNGDVAVAELKIVKEAAKQVRPGGTLGYTVTVTNIGKVDYLAQEPAPPTSTETTTTETTTTETTTTTTDTVTVQAAAPQGIAAAAEETTTSSSAREPAPAPAKPAVGPATWADDLSAVLDDAAYSGDASATAGEVSYAQPVLTWSGPVAVGAAVTITYSVHVNEPMTGDRTMINSIVAPDSNCTCTATTLVVPELAATGSNVGWLVLYGVLMVLVGIGIVFLATRRRRNRNEA